MYMAYAVEVAGVGLALDHGLVGGLDLLLVEFLPVDRLEEVLTTNLQGIIRTSTKARNKRFKQL